MRCGGGGGNRTHVRKLWAAESTRLSDFFFHSKQAKETGKLTCMNVLQYVYQPSPEGDKTVENPANQRPEHPAG